MATSGDCETATGPERRRRRNALVGSCDRPSLFGAFYEAHYPDLLRYFVHGTRNGQVGLDLTAETFAKAFEKRHTFRGDNDIQAAAWVWAIARNELAGFRRARRLEVRAIERLDLERPEATDDQLRELERIAGLELAQERIHEAISNLPPDQRAVIALRFREDLDAPAVGSRLGIPSDAVRARLSRAYRTLRASRRVCEALEALESQ
jgi:RNA polymerase sigma factor (sigma-70 family)